MHSICPKRSWVHCQPRSLHIYPGPWLPSRTQVSVPGSNYPLRAPLLISSWSPMPGHSDSPKFIKSPGYGVLYSSRVARFIQGEPGLPRTITHELQIVIHPGGTWSSTYYYPWVPNSHPGGTWSLAYCITHESPLYGVLYSSSGRSVMTYRYSQEGILCIPRGGESGLWRSIFPRRCPVYVVLYRTIEAWFTECQVSGVIYSVVEVRLMAY